MTVPEPPRPPISEIIRDSGKISSDPTGASNDQLASMAAAVTGASAGTFLVSQALSDELAKRFRRLSTKATAERDVPAPYGTAGRALILALQACGHILNAAFDTATGAILQTRKPMSLLSPPFSVTIAMADNGASTHLSAEAQHTGLDWGQNAKVAAELFDKTDEYLKLFER